MYFAPLLASLLLQSAPLPAQEPAKDTIQILSVTPQGAVRADKPITFTFDLMVTLESADEAAIEIGFNSKEPMQSAMTHIARIKRGTRRIQGTVKTTPRDWGRVSAFAALIIIAPTSGLGLGFRPSAPTQYPIDVISDAPTSVSSDAEFKTADAAVKRRILEELGRGGTTLAIDSVIEIITHAAVDQDSEVRLLAMKAVGGRALASVLAQVRWHPSAADNAISARKSVAPREWFDDHERLGRVLWDAIAERVRRDRDGDVRLAALAALKAFDRFDGLSPYSEELMALCIEAFQNDRSAEVRAAAIGTLAGGVNDTSEIRAAIMQALRDPDDFVRRMATSAINMRPNRTPLVPYSDAESALLLQLNDPGPGYRVTAIEALAAYGAAATPALPRLDRMALNDPNDEVRSKAGATAKMIRSTP